MSGWGDAPADDVTRILGIDPGSKHVGVAIIDVPDDGGLPSVVDSGDLDPARALRCARTDLGGWQYAERVAIEQVGHYGKGITPGKEVYDTCVLIGRLCEALESRGAKVELVTRPQVNLEFTGLSRATKAEVWQAAVDLYGGTGVAQAGKKCPTCKGKGWRGRERAVCDRCDGGGWYPERGPLYGVMAHSRDALEAALYISEMTRTTVVPARSSWT